jgi:outer membrane lipoprotein carrier protein
MMCALIVLFVVFGGRVRAGDEAKDIVGNLQKKYESVQDVAINFTEHVKFGVTGNEDEFKGTLKLKKGNKYRIELEQQTIVTDGASVWSYSVANGQVLIDKYKDDPKAFTPDKVLVNLSDTYIATYLGKEKGTGNELSIIKLVPKDKNSNLEWIKLWVDSDEWVVRKSEVQDVSDNVTTYTVNDIKFNTGLAEKVFQFEPPKGAQIIDLR